jgi:hypothetical protein
VFSLKHGFNSWELFRGDLASKVHCDADNRVDGVRLRLWTAATIGPIFHPPGDRSTYVWRTMVELYLHGKTDDSSITALWQSYQQSPSTNQEELGKENDEFYLTKYLFHNPKGSLICRKILRRGADGFTSPPKEGLLQTLSPLKIHRLAGFKPANRGSNDKHAKHYTTETAKVWIYYTTIYLKSLSKPQSVWSVRWPRLQLDTSEIYGSELTTGSRLVCDVGAEWEK